MEQWIPFIQEIGFPIIVTFYLLHRIETKLDTLIDSIQSLSDHMAPEQYQVKKII
ncbi:YvrJ family protein [Litchfieldia salsa]|uniref:YvrJ protein family protein n=1 Tax=Litchfieldia salsa TaxID=930152 RepID=A0A1H0W7G5_9BACI|nr:YvrJ family protein [Litchfieldia salsa]SDP86568.1 YvrJ protein family protein [Litchfieldia salsa]